MDIWAKLFAPRNRKPCYSRPLKPCTRRQCVGTWARFLEGPHAGRTGVITAHDIRTGMSTARLSWSLRTVRLPAGHLQARR